MEKSKVAVLKTKPETVFNDILRLCDLADLKKFLDPTRPVILKDNISWHFPFLSANTTPWQLEGTISGLKKAGFSALIALHNNTVVTDSFKGSRLNKLDSIYRRFGIPEKYNFRSEDVTWEIYQPKARMRVLHQIYRNGIRVPDVL